MTSNELVKRITSTEENAKSQIASASSVAELKTLYSKYLGGKGEIPKLLKELPSIPPDERAGVGKLINETKGRLESLFEEREKELRQQEESQRFVKEKVDLSFPGRKISAGLPHVLCQTFERIKKAFIGLGFEYFESPELETFEYNFAILNYPPDHPAIDEQDTFYIDDVRLMRTQCTAFQGRVFETKSPPFREFTIGRCFRNDAVDRTHSHTFHQVDAFMVDEGVSMAHLKGTLGAFARAMFGKDVKVRFRPDYFPFVEPGVDYAISCPFCGAHGCAVCKHTGWIELGGAGMVHPFILQRYGIDTERFTGFAFGLGVERIPMMQYQIDDLRLFMENDIRFLEQFIA
ncbi:MAG TPA: phenylalanine--tRNA ligase subunit alpha [Fimbriimonadales bacterium]|nr:phenylalanine--tRNA ligase subunit alpha [Fimbriimonadales bacterium]